MLFRFFLFVIFLSIVFAAIITFIVWLINGYIKLTRKIIEIKKNKIDTITENKIKDINRSESVNEAKDDVDNVNKDINSLNDIKDIYKNLDR